MAKFYFITALLLLQGCIYVCGTTTSTPTPTPTPSPTPSPSPSTSASASASSSTSTSTSTSTSPITTSTSGSQSTPPNVTPTPTSPPSTSIAPTTPPTIGPVVIMYLYIKVSSCNANLNLTSSQETIALMANVTTNVKTVYQGKAAVHTVVLINNTCISSQKYVVLYINVTFIKDSIKAGEIIEDVMKDAIKDNLLGDLPVSSTQYKCIFYGVTLGEYKVKAGECVRVCCGAGGPIVLERSCSPTVRCEGIRTTKEEADNCPNESNAKCKDVVCPDPGNDKACSSLTPSFALLLLLTVATFLKITAY